MAVWLYQPVMFDSSHDFDCEGFTDEQCAYYKKPWHNWYVADWSFALPTVAFFMCAIGIFIIGYAITQLLANFEKARTSSFYRRVLAATRYLSYRGWYVERLNWNTAPIGLLLLALAGTTFFFCMDLIPSPYYWPGPSMVWGNSPPLGTRSGWLALACMPFLFATASKTNWITLVTGVTHEKLQVFHRWIAHAFMVLALMHTFPFIVWHIRNHDMVNQFTVSNIFEYWTGVVALLFQAWLTFASWGPFRSLGYEFFKASHFVSVVVFMVIFFWHCGGTLTSWHYFVATAAIYVPCWTYSWLRTLFEYGGTQKAQLNVEENGFVRISIQANFTWTPGQHCFLRFRNFGLHALTSHPFTICSSPSTAPGKSSEMVFYIRPRSGLTARLHKLAANGTQIPVMVDGPYGGIDNQKYFGSDRVVVIAGGSGAGWILPMVEQFLLYKSRLTQSMGEQKPESIQQDFQQQDFQQINGPRSLHIILATRDIPTRTWFESTLKELISSTYSANSSDVDVDVHLTGAAEKVLDTSNSSSASSTSADHDPEKMTVSKRSAAVDEMRDSEVRGRPDLPSIIRDEAAAASASGRTVGVFACGPLSMQNDIRNAVAEENLRILGRGGLAGMYLHLEHFSWA